MKNKLMELIIRYNLPVLTGNNNFYLNLNNPLAINILSNNGFKVIYKESICQPYYRIYEK